MQKKLKSKVFSASSVLILSLSFSFSLRPPSFFFLSLSHSLCDRLLSSFSLFLILSGTAFSLLSLSFSVFVSPRSSWFHLLLFIDLFLYRKKKTMDMVSIFFWALFWSSFSVHHYHFFYFTGFNWRLQRHAYEICRSSIHFCCGYLFFLVSQANWYFSLCFFQRSNGFFGWSYFSSV